MVETIDNNEVKLVDKINSILEYSSFSKMAVGYFYLSGFEAIRDKLSKVQNLKILIDNTTSQETVEELAKGFTKLDLAKNYKKKEQDKITSSQKSKILDDSKASLSSQIENIEQSNVKIEALKTLSDFIKNKRIEIKIYTKGKLHSKAYLFEDERANKTDNKIIIGSSNLSISGLHHNSEMNVLIHGKENYKNLERWFDKLWDEAEPFDEAIMEVLENSWLQYEITPYEMYLKTLYELTKDRIELDFDESILEDMHFSHLYDFQKKHTRELLKY
jgi:phosphatidylserine/phosphatidylglycerophosphate/cardiolipin synthase-like enzyme